MVRRTNINFKFAKNWKTFFNWHKALKVKGAVPPWEDQIIRIQVLFESTERNLIDWRLLWNDLNDWYERTRAKNNQVLWSEQQRQIETLLLNQVKDLDKEQFVLVYLNDKNQPCMDVNKMSYWEACRVQKQLSGNGNGEGGAEDMDKITVINLKSLIK